MDFEVDEYVKDIDRKEILEKQERLEKITEFILNDWYKKTKKGKFNAIFATSNIATLKKYYTLLLYKTWTTYKKMWLLMWITKKSEG